MLMSTKNIIPSTELHRCQCRRVEHLLFKPSSTEISTSILAERREGDRCGGTHNNEDNVGTRHNYLAAIHLRQEKSVTQRHQCVRV